MQINAKLSAYQKSRVGWKSRGTTSFYLKTEWLHVSEPLIAKSFSIPRKKELTYE